MIDKQSEENIQQFILAHQHDDPTELLLSASKYPDMPMRYVAAQIKARNKAKTKLPSWWENKNVVFPPTLSMEQCSSEKCAKLKALWVDGESLVDLTGGTGVDSYFLSKQFHTTIYVEQNAELCRIARHNFKQLNSDITIFNEDAESFLSNDKCKADCIYIDPARRDDVNRKLYKLSDCSPDVAALLPRLFECTDTILIKTSPILDIKAAVSSLNFVYKVNVVAVNNEVKEVIYHLRKGYPDDFTVCTYNLKKTGDQQLFEFKFNSEKNTPVEFSGPLNYLYEPNNAILKSGGFKCIGHSFGIKKLEANSHLYTSSKLIANFPGRKFKIEAVCKLNKKDIKAVLNTKKANITVRNFPMSVDNVYKKLGLQPGGDCFLFATTILHKQLVVLVCSKIV